MCSSDLHQAVERSRCLNRLMHHSVCGVRPCDEFRARREQQGTQPRIGKRFVEQTLKRNVNHAIPSKGVVAEILCGSKKRPLGRRAPQFGQRGVQAFTLDDAPKHFGRRYESFCQRWTQSNG